MSFQHVSWSRCLEEGRQQRVARHIDGPEEREIGNKGGKRAGLTPEDDTAWHGDHWPGQQRRGQSRDERKGRTEKEGD